MSSESLPPPDKIIDGEGQLQAAAEPLASSVRSGAIWSVASTVLLRVANILLTAVVAHILDPRDFGVFAVALTAYAIVSSLGEFGVSSCLIRADLDIGFLAPTVVTTSFVTSAIMAVAMVAFARPIAAALGTPNAAGPVRVMALAVILVGLFAVPTSQLVRDFRQDKVFLSNAVSFVPSTAVLILLAVSGDGAMAFAWSRVVGQFVAGCVLVMSVRERYWPGISRRALSVIVKFGLPLAGANFVNFILLNVDYALVGHLMGAVALGTYVLAFNVASWPASLLGSMINSVSMPAFSRVKHDALLLRAAMADSLRGVALVVMPMCAMIAVLARPLVLTLYGAKWAHSADVLVVLSFYGGISIICLLFANMLAGLGRTKFLLGVQLIWLGALIPAMALGVRHDGIVGAAYAHIAVIGPIVLPSYLLVLRRVTGVRLTALGKAALPAFLASAAAAVAARGTVSLFVNPLAQLLAGLVVGGLVYLVVAAPMVIELFYRGRALQPRVRTIQRLYNNMARSVGLPVGSGPKHAMSTSRTHTGRDPEQIGLRGGEGALGAEVIPSPLSDASQSAAAALALLISLSRPG